jgi:hypothetical protein
LTAVEPWTKKVSHKHCAHLVHVSSKFSSLPTLSLTCTQTVLSIKLGCFHGRKGVLGEVLFRK